MFYVVMFYTASKCRNSLLDTKGFIMFIIIFLFFGIPEIAGQISTENVIAQTPECANTELRASCQNGSVIAVRRVRYGTKLISSCSSSECCEYNADDCFLDYTEKTLELYCTGREVCRDYAPAETDRSNCGPDFPVFSHYLTMDYYCISASRILPICSPASTTTLTQPLYLQNNNYPGQIRGIDTSCSCSIETTKCASKINIYFVHFELGDNSGSCSDNQKITLLHNGSSNTYTCSQNTDYSISLVMTSSSNYLTVKFENPDAADYGYFWIGFEATDNTAYLNIDCPIKEQIYCNDCSALEAPVNGMVSFSSTYNYQSVATFTCDTGYSLEGNSTRECQILGTWSGENPNCTLSDCGNLTNPVSGFVSVPVTTYQSVATYNCDTGYTLIGNKTRQCQANKMWSGEAPTCDINDCGNLTDPANGFVSVSVTTYQSVVTYNCNTGYTLVGNKTRQCQADKTWSGEAPTCDINDCGNLSDPVNGLVSVLTTTYQSVATYNCNTGYTLAGNNTRQCQADKTWSGEAPTCVISDCASLADPVNGLVSVPTSTYQSVATYSCNTGYTLVGNITRKCQADKTWSGAAPTCDINDCGNLSDPDNGFVSFSASYYQSVATYNCNTGYTLMGNKTRKCQADETWSREAPTCDINKCGNLSNPVNGLVSVSTTTYQSVATYSCNTGYTLVENETRQCQANKTWSGAVPKCDINDCDSLRDPINGSVSFSSTTYQSLATYTCNTGFTLEGQTTRTCLANKTWSSVIPTCIINDCGNLTDPVNGLIFFSATTYQSVSTYSCNTGYTLVGNEIRTCQAERTWSGEEPTCEIHYCSTLTAPINGTVSFSAATYQSFATYSCDPGYSPVGNQVRECQADKSWSGIAPTCKIKSCGNLSSPLNGSVSFSSTTYQSTATYNCSFGFTLVGPKTRICQADTTWNDAAPTCHINDCGNLSYPEHGSVLLIATTYQSVATYDCYRGYELVGSRSRICQADTIWSGTAPKCRINDCGNLSDPENGKISLLNGTTYKSVATFECNDGYSLVGETTRACQANSEWSGSTPTCKINSCENLRAPSQGSVTTSDSSSYRSVATYSCNDGYTLVGVTTRTCHADNTWTADTPICAINDCGPLESPSNGHIQYSDGTTYLSAATYICNVGYRVAGEETRICQANSNWSSKDPACDLIDCNILESPANGSVDLSEGVLYMSKATFRCDPGFLLAGSSLLTCEADGNWSNTSPVCQMIETTLAPISPPVTVANLSIGWIIAIVAGVILVFPVVVLSYVWLSNKRNKKHEETDSKRRMYVHSTDTLSVNDGSTINISGLHPKLRPEDHTFFIDHPKLSTKSPTLYSGPNSINSSFCSGSTVSPLYGEPKSNHRTEGDKHSNHIKLSKLNIRGLHPQLRPEDRKYYVDNPRQKGPSLYSGHSDVSSISHHRTEGDKHFNHTKLSDPNIRGLHPHLRSKDRKYYIDDPRQKGPSHHSYSGQSDVSIISHNNSTRLRDTMSSELRDDFSLQ